jgi:hypothetical protein
VLHVMLISSSLTFVVASYDDSNSYLYHHESKLQSKHCLCI